MYYVCSLIAQDKLYFRLGRTGSDRGELLVIDRDTLEAKEVGKIEAPGVMFSDGENLGIVAPTKDVSGLLCHFTSAPLFFHSLYFCSKFTQFLGRFRCEDY